ncbi:MAG: secondary thiamine-phosphate synthase enzyme [Dehalococcoidia bacterium]|nr:secondary thiamine-phosphate synthase enzyme [Dehalococcoidia bacterium]MQG15814.1 YjbQ family protein [SAR202 cluster bacterium]|tara:strand:+ start:4050 stop:4541 length:492 start_codon:yes stop_codon:yes gene_type:complete
MNTEMKVEKATFNTNFTVLKVETSGSPKFFDITDQVTELVDASKINNGLVCVFSQHTTAAVVIQEDEPLLMTDLSSFIERLAPKDAHYRHNDFNVRTVHMHEDECPNGHSHCQNLVLGTSESIPIVQGKMILGQWQRIFVIELDADKANQISHRNIAVQIMGI